MKTNIFDMEKRYSGRFFLFNALLGLLCLISCLYPGQEYGFEIELSSALTSKTYQDLSMSGSYVFTFGEGVIDECGFCYSSKNAEPEKDNAVAGQLSGKSFTAAISGLSASTVYYVRPYARSGACYIYGAVQKITTNAKNLYEPVLTAPASASLKVTSATLTATVSQSDDTYPVTEAGFCYSKTNTTPKKTDSESVQVEVVNHQISHTFNNLDRQTTYYVRAYAINSMGTYYGSMVSFTTICPVAFGVPAISAQTEAGFTVTATAEVKSAEYQIVSSGFCYSYSKAVPRLESGSGITADLVSSSMTANISLGTNITAFVRPYVKCNDAYAYYGEAVKTGDKSFTANNVAFSMVAVNGGSFTMGATEEQLRSADMQEEAWALSAPYQRPGNDLLSPLRAITSAYTAPVALRSVRDNEKPAHEVTLSHYYIGKYEVNQALWEAVMGSNPSGYKNVNNPVENVSWYDCVAFADKLSTLTGKLFVLPTEAQWEYAARGACADDTLYKYSGSDAYDEVAWVKANANGSPQAIGMKLPNVLGIYDMSGNIAEKCYDWYADDYYSNSPENNPAGPVSGVYRAQRGGDYYNTEDRSRLSSRDYRYPDSAYLNFGLRIALVEGLTKASVEITNLSEITYDATYGKLTGTISAKVTSSGSGTVSEKGICIATTENPDLSSDCMHFRVDTTTDAFDLILYGFGYNVTYYLRPYVITEAGVAYGEQKTCIKDGTDLSASETANCYVVSSSGNYTFKATVMGNGVAGIIPVGNFHTTTASISPSSATILWTDNTSLITDVALSDGYVRFIASGSEGNALIAVKDASDNILWSWHIWCTDAPSDQAYTNHASKSYTLLDRNLGATDATSGTKSMLYQWGRKDPFPNYYPLYNADGTTFVSSDSWPNTATTSSSVGTISYASLHPTIYLTSSNASSYDWYYGGGSGYANRNNYLWGNPTGYTSDYPTGSKSIYDPCPPGYMVAPMDTWTNFTTTGDYTSTTSQFNVNGSFNSGWKFYLSGSSGNTTWYPASGWRNGSGGSLLGVGSYVSCWSSSPNLSSSDYAGFLYFVSGSVNPLNYSNRGLGQAVRCLRR